MPNFTVRDVGPGWVKLQADPYFFACMDGGEWDCWLFRAYSDGRMVSVRKLERFEILQVEDQEHYGIVLQGEVGKNGTAV